MINMCAIVWAALGMKVFITFLNGGYYYVASNPDGSNNLAQIQEHLANVFKITHKSTKPLLAQLKRIKTRLSLETLFEKHFLTIFTDGYATDGSCKNIMRTLERRQGAAATSLSMAIGLPNRRRTKRQQLNYLTIVPFPDGSKPVPSLFMLSHRLFGTTVLDKWYGAIPKIDVGCKDSVLQSNIRKEQDITASNQDKDSYRTDDGVTYIPNIGDYVASILLGRQTSLNFSKFRANYDIASYDRYCDDMWGRNMP